MLKPKIITVAVGMALLSSCVKDTIYNTDHPDQARVTISTDWSDRGADVAKPSAYTVTAPGVSENATSERHTVKKLFDPGSHPFALYNDAEGITVSGGSATVNTATSPTGFTGTFVNPLPGWLFTGTQTAILEKDTEPTVNVAMHQQVRQLTLLIEPDGGAADDIKSITASLSGVAGEWNIEKDAPSEDAVNVAPAFIKQPDGTWSATVRLLGVTGEEQKLTGTLTVDGVSEPVELDGDLTPALTNFNRDKKTLLTLKSGIVVEPDPVEAGFTATINKWTVVTGNGTAD